jgi:hypothetical protein
MSALEVYLDTNTVTYLFRKPGFSPDELKGFRESLVRSIRDDRLLVIGSQRHLEELARITYKEPDFYREVHAFFCDVVGPFLLLPTDELIRLEVQLGRGLIGNERFDLWTRCQQLKRATRDIQFAKDLGDEVYGQTKQSKLDGEARRQEFRTRLAAEFKDVSPADASRRWWATAEGQIDDWMTDYMTKSQQLLELPKGRSQWPPVRALQTAWNIHAFLMARIFLNVGLNRRIGDGDLYDAHHYASACYSQLLVTDDGAFRETCDLIPNRSLSLEGFADFVRRL